MKDEMKTWTKAKLYSEMERYKKIIAEIGKPTNTKESQRLNRYKGRLKRARQHFYECRICADAKIETYIDPRGDEKERFIKGCGQAECPYHDYFIDLMNGNEDDVTRGLRIFLSRY